MRTPGIYRGRLVNLRQRWLRFDAAARLHGAEPTLSGDRCGGVLFFFHSSYSPTVLFCVLLMFVFPVCFLCFVCHYVFNFFLFLIPSYCFPSSSPFCFFIFLFLLEARRRHGRKLALLRVSSVAEARRRRGLPSLDGTP